VPGAARELYVGFPSHSAVGAARRPRQHRRAVAQRAAGRGYLHCSNPRAAAAEYRRGQTRCTTSAQQQQHSSSTAASVCRCELDNIAVALGRRQLAIEQLGVWHWRVMAWDGAGNALPAGYDRLLALADGNYLEAGNQGHQLVNLLAGRVDVILSDRLIFEWQRRQLLPASLEHTPPLRIYPLLPPKEAGLLFRDRPARAGGCRIRALKASPQYQAS
jgi:hypothetical protein